MHHGKEFRSKVFSLNPAFSYLADSTAEGGFWSIAVGAAAEASVKAGKPVLINDLLHEAGLEI